MRLWQATLRADPGRRDRPNDAVGRRDQPHSMSPSDFCYERISAPAEQAQEGDRSRRERTVSTSPQVAGSAPARLERVSARPVRAGGWCRRYRCNTAFVAFSATVMIAFLVLFGGDQPLQRFMQIPYGLLLLAPIVVWRLERQAEQRQQSRQEQRVEHALIARAAGHGLDPLVQHGGLGSAGAPLLGQPVGESDRSEPVDLVLGEEAFLGCQLDLRVEVCERSGSREQYVRRGAHSIAVAIQ